MTHLFYPSPIAARSCSGDCLRLFAGSRSNDSKLVCAIAAQLTIARLFFCGTIEHTADDNGQKSIKANMTLMSLPRCHPNGPVLRPPLAITVRSRTKRAKPSSLSSQSRLAAAELRRDKPESVRSFLRRKAAEYLKLKLQMDINNNTLLDRHSIDEAIK